MNINKPTTKQPYQQQTKTTGQTIRTTETRSNRKPLSIIAVIVALILIPVISFTVLKEPLLALLKPKSPFSTELSAKMKIPLYYPTKLPGSFKMEVNSITQPEAGVILYAITNNNEDKINISIQRQAEDMDSKITSSNLSNPKDVETKYGTAKLGTTANDLEVANVMTGQSWIIITSPINTLSEKDLVLIVNSMVF